MNDRFRHIRNRIIAGVFVVLPVFITYMVIRWLYDLLNLYALSPIAYALKQTWGKNPNVEQATKAVEQTGFFSPQVLSWGSEVAVSVLAFGFLVAILWLAGMFAQSRLHRLFDWILLNVPGVRVVYSAVNKVFEGLSVSQTTKDFKRVVLVEFPHPGMKAPAFVTNECKEESTGKTILSIYVPTTPVPTSGYMLLVPEEDVVPLNWDLEETLQAIVSGGIAVPKTVSYSAPA